MVCIFDLDGTLADCEHRRHFVEAPEDNSDYELYIAPLIELKNRSKHDKYIHKETGKLWHPDWKSFYEACDKDLLIEPTYTMFQALHAHSREVQIWSGRCESVREKTIDWLIENVGIEWTSSFDSSKHLKMRPIGDFTPDDQLKERWLDDLLRDGTKKVDFVFDDRKKACDMWKRRGIFVFSCNMTESFDYL